MVKVESFENNSKIRYGNGTVAQVGDLLHQRSVNRVLIVTDPGVVAVGIVERVISSLSEANIAYFVFDEVEPNPSLETAELIARVYQEENASGMIAVGGGSPIDAAKGAGILVTNRGDLRSFADGGKIAYPLPPLVAIPTTVGTGSEVTKFAVLTDHDAVKKLMFTGKVLIPDIAILDPELVYSLPSQIVAATGMDALTHAIESMLSLFAKPSSDALAIEAIGLITESLLTAVLARHSAEGQIARSQMLYASTLAGLAFNEALLGLVHGMSHPLTSYVGVAHGLANALLLPHIMRFNAPACAPALGRVAHAMGKPRTPEAATRAVEQLISRLNLPSSLRQLGVDEEFLPYMVEDASSSANAQLVNPRKATKEEIANLYRKLL